MVRQDARDGVPTVLRCWLPARFRSVGFRCPYNLGDDGALAGVSGAEYVDIAGAIGGEGNGLPFGRAARASSLTGPHAYRGTIRWSDRVISCESFIGRR